MNSKYLLAFLLIVLLLFSGCPEKQKPGEKPKPGDISLKQEGHCSDGTPNSFCSDSKPKQCLEGKLIDNCEKCGCPGQQKCMNNSCTEECIPVCESICGGEDNGCGEKCSLNEGISCGENKFCKSGQCLEKPAPEKCSSEDCKFLVVMVESIGKPVEGAKVKLYNSVTGFLTEHKEQLTDEKGIAKFFGVESGKYHAFAFKGESSAKSQSHEFLGGMKNPEFKVDLTLTEGIVRIQALDNYNSVVQFATVDLFDFSSNKKIGSGLSDATGVFEASLPAGQIIYVRVSKENYSSYVSSAKPVLPSAVQVFKAVLEPEIVGKNIEIQFKGLFKENQAVSVLSPGEEYSAKFLLKIPKKDYLEAGFHIRTGSSKLMEKDNLFIKEVIVPAATVIKATTYDEDSGLDESAYGLTLAESKWFNASFDKPSSEVRETEALVKVRETASIGNELSLFFRAYAKIGRTRERSPVDDLVESKELYSNAFQKIFAVGVESLCAGEFCFNASVRDVKEDLTESFQDLFKAKIFNEYELRFELLNNSKTKIHDNANIRIKNESRGIMFLDYDFFDAESKPIRGTVNEFEFPRIDVGNMLPAKKLTGSFKFVPQRSASDVINFKLVSDQKVVFEKNLTISTSAPGKLSMSLSDLNFAPGKESDLNVFIKDKDSGLELDGVVVRLKDLQGNIILYEETGRDGWAYLRVPARSTGTSLIVEARKPDYDVEQVKIKIE